MEQIGRGKSLKHECGGVFIAERVGNFHDTGGLYDAAIRVRPNATAGIGHTVSFTELGNAITNSVDGAGRFHSHDCR